MTAAPLPPEQDAIAKVLWIFVPPARTMLAPRIHALGVRVHPKLATKRLVREGPVQDANWAPQRIEPIDANHQMLNPPTTAEEVDRVERTAAMAMVLATVMQPRLATDIAPELDALGVRLHPELATGSVRVAAPKIKDLLTKSGNPLLANLADRIDHANKMAAKGDFSARDKLGDELRPAAMEQLAGLRRKSPTIKAEDLEPVVDGIS